MMMMEEKLVINELEQGKELANQLLSNLKHTSSIDSNETLISEILRIYQNAIFMLSFQEDKNGLKRSSEIFDKDSKFKKRKITEKKIEKVRVCVGTEEDDGYSWRKYGQKEIHGSKNPRGYFRCTHRFTQNCLAVKQVQKSDKDPSMLEVKYLGNHTCNTTSPNFSVSFNKTETLEDIIMKPTKSEEVMISLEDLENKKNIFRTFSFSDHEIENDWWNNDSFLKDLSPATSGSGITNEIVTVSPAASGFVENSETADSYFSSLDNIMDFGQDWLWS